MPGFIAAQRFEVAQDAHDLAGPYVAICEMDPDAPDAILAAPRAAATNGKMVISDAMDDRAVSVTLLKAITDRVTV